MRRFRTVIGDGEGGQVFAQHGAQRAGVDVAGHTGRVDRRLHHTGRNGQVRPHERAQDTSAGENSSNHSSASPKAQSADVEKWPG